MMSEGLCKCGCGQITKIAYRNLSRLGWIKGEHIPFIKGHNAKGQLSRWWNGGKKKHTDGYVLILKPNHPRADNSGYVFEHVLVMEKHLNRLISSKEAIHHIDGDVANNNPGNLMVFADNIMHKQYHAACRKIQRDGCPTTR